MAISTIVVAFWYITEGVAGMVADHISSASSAALFSGNVAVSVVEVAWSYVAFGIAGTVA